MRIQLPGRLLFQAMLIIVIAACGGNGGSSASIPAQPGYSTAVVKVCLNGSLPAKTAISGVGFSLRFPGSFVPATSGNTTAAWVVTPAGIFKESMLLPPIYKKSAADNTGNLQIILAHTSPAGTTQTGELATIILQLQGGSTPSSADFIVQNPTIVDLVGNTITEMTVNVTTVELHGFVI